METNTSREHNFGVFARAEQGQKGEVDKRLGGGWGTVNLVEAGSHNVGLDVIDRY